eukprot:gene9583-biopygen5801
MKHVQRSSTGWCCISLNTVQPVILPARGGLLPYRVNGSCPARGAACRRIRGGRPWADALMLRRHNAGHAAAIGNRSATHNSLRPPLRYT